MAHSLIRAVPRTTYTSVATAVDIVLVKYLITAPFVSMATILKIHTTPSTANNWILRTRPASFSEEEPNTFFTTSSGELAITFTQGSPNLFVAPFVAPVPDRVSLILSCPAVAATTTISVDLLGRDA